MAPPVLPHLKNHSLAESSKISSWASYFEHHHLNLTLITIMRLNHHIQHIFIKIDSLISYVWQHQLCLNTKRTWLHHQIRWYTMNTCITISSWTSYFGHHKLTISSHSTYIYYDRQFNLIFMAPLLCLNSKIITWLNHQIHDGFMAPPVVSHLKNHSLTESSNISSWASYFGHHHLNLTLITTRWLNHRIQHIFIKIGK